MLVTLSVSKGSPHCLQQHSSPNPEPAIIWAHTSWYTLRHTHTHTHTYTRTCTHTHTHTHTFVRECRPAVLETKWIVILLFRSVALSIKWGWGGHVVPVVSSSYAVGKHRIQHRLALFSTRTWNTIAPNQDSTRYRNALRFTEKQLATETFAAESLIVVVSNSKVSCWITDSYSK